VRGVTPALLALACSLAAGQPLRPAAFHAPAPDRETLRAQILAEERETQRERLVVARMRLADRIRSGDLRGAEEARRSITRLEEALESLGREIERAPARLTVRLAPAESPAPGAGLAAGARPPAAFPPASPSPAWWDVYGAAGRGAAGAPPTASEPPQP
jgi:hypothetical protein